MAAQQPTQNKIQASQITLPKGGGAIQGMGETFQANSFSGTGSLSVPIAVSPCRNFAPQLALSYSSGAGNGPWGMGFSVGLPRITRQTRKGTPQYRDTDTFVLSGAADLVPLDNGQRSEILQGITYAIQRYQPRQEGSFALLEYWKPQTGPQGQSFWKVTTADHTISIFGKTAQAKIADPSHPDHVFTWLLEESYNTTGDHQLFSYKQENTDNVPNLIYEKGHVVTANRYIERIQYGNEQPIATSLLLDPIQTPIQWHFEVVFDYGEYDITPTSNNPYNPVRSWAYRPDPFSSYEAGFEMRTYRRCAHTLMFHRFDQELGSTPVLVHATSYDYQANAAQLSECIHIRQTGYTYDTAQQTYTRATLPPLTLTYTPFQPEGHTFVLLTDEQNRNLAGLNEYPNYTLVDLHGQGIPGILYNEKAGNYYREPRPSYVPSYTGTGPEPLQRNLLDPATASMHYSNWRLLDPFPAQREVEGVPGVMLNDITGNGKMKVVETPPNPLQGYWEAEPDYRWKPFKTLDNWSANYPAPSQSWVDVTGDGIADLVQLTEDQVLIYPNARERGLGHPIVQAKAPGMPATLESSLVEVIQFADMAGSGQAHLVRIRSGEVVYWPNLSYGRFGAPIRMKNAPHFGEDFNATRLFLADVDGSGTMDLVYVTAREALIYFNYSGNALSDPISIPLPTTFDSIDQITFADIYGRGNACLVLSETHTTPSPRHWCYDFCQGQKPYLLYKSDNHMGATTEITYGSSVDFYLADKKAGLPWITALPFPVQVVTQVRHADAISGSHYVSQYAYHHGYYDGEEREFRGFGRVDRQDAEYFPPSEVDPDQDPQYVAPSLSRTWYHTGAYLENDSLSRQYAKEYYRGDAEAFAFPDSTIDWKGHVPSGESMRQAYVALAGTVLRAELYGLDDSPLTEHPYSVSESNFKVRLEQPKGEHRYAIFYVHPEQSLSYTYERNPADPQITQSCVLEVDAYGHVEKSCSIAYPRRQVAGALAEQQKLHVTCATQQYINQSDPDNYLLGVAFEGQGYEITTLSPIAGEMFSSQALEQAITTALATLTPAAPSSNEAKLLSWNRVYYTQVTEDGTHNLPLGSVSLPVLLATGQAAEFSQAQVTEAFQDTPLQAEALQAKLESGYYKKDTTSNYWWSAGSSAEYFGADQFYAASATVDPAGNKTTYTYDSHHLFLTQVTDALGNTVKSTAIDYQHLQPMQLIDANGNTSEAKLDPLGRVIYTSHYGHEAGQPQGFAPISQAPTAVPSSLQDILDHPAEYLGNLQSYFYYDPFAWQERQEPVWGIGLMAEQYPSAAAARIQIALSYSDGFGRVLCSKAKVEEGEAFLYDPLTHQITEGMTEDRWLTSGKTVYNNKGNAVKQYEPYYINTPEYITSPIVDTFGVSPTIYYDPLDRVIKTITAKGYLLTHAWTAWEETGSDANDTFVTSPYCKVNVLELDSQSIYYDTDLSGEDRQALAAIINNPSNPNPPSPSTALGRALVYNVQYFANTPARSVRDNLGRVIISQVINKSQDTPAGEVLSSYYTYDILGRELTSADPRLHAAGKYNFESTYSLTGAVLKHISADADTRWALSNTLGNPIWGYDERQVTITPSYDVLHRPTQVHVHKVATIKDPLTLDQVVEKIIYGDTPGAINNPEENNLRGQLYKHYDQAGVVTVPSYSLLGANLKSQRQFRVDYKAEVNWNDPSTVLQSHIYEQQTEYDALGRVVQDTDVDGNIVAPTYHRSGWLKAIQVTPISGMNPTQQAIVEDITYNAKGQRLQIDYGNTTSTQYSYDLKTQKPIHIQTLASNASVLQDLVYVYDPAGNIVAKTDNSQQTVYHNNQEVTPTTTYTYDSLYRLIQGTGREKIGNSASQSGRQIPLIAPAPGARDNLALQNYIEKYSYDSASNLIKTQHIAQQDSWTRNIVIANFSNRGVIATINGTDQPAPTPDEVDQFFDVHGNQIQTQQFYPLVWNYRDNLQQATVITHADGTQDGEYYVYDGSGQRVRKVNEQYGQNGQVITFKETLYVGVEYRRTLQGTNLETATVIEEYHSLRAMDDKKCVATMDYWIVGNPPTGFASSAFWRYHLDDYLGSCTVEVDEAGEQISYEEYSPYGSSLLFIGTASASELKHYRYSGQERDSVTGFYYYGARYYAPWLGRWLSPDPAGTVDGLNLYAFVGGNPATSWDVGGREKRKAEEKGKEKVTDETDEREKYESTPLGDGVVWVRTYAKFTKEVAAEILKNVTVGNSAFGGKKVALTPQRGKKGMVSWLKGYGNADPGDLQRQNKTIAIYFKFAMNIKKYNNWDNDEEFRSLSGTEDTVQKGLLDYINNQLKEKGIYQGIVDQYTDLSDLKLNGKVNANFTTINQRQAVMWTLAAKTLEKGGGIHHLVVPEGNDFGREGYGAGSHLVITIGGAYRVKLNMSETELGDKIGVSLSATITISESEEEKKAKAKARIEGFLARNRSKPKPDEPNKKRKHDDPPPPGGGAGMLIAS